MNVLRMKQENDAWVANLHNIHVHCMCFSLSASLCPMSLFSIRFVLFIHICPASTEMSIQMLVNLYKCLTATTNALLTIRMACDWLQICCEWLEICCKYAFLANFRSTFLILVKP